MSPSLSLSDRRRERLSRPSARLVCTSCTPSVHLGRHPSVLFLKKTMFLRTFFFLRGTPGRAALLGEKLALGPLRWRSRPSAPDARCRLAAWAPGLGRCPNVLLSQETVFSENIIIPQSAESGGGGSNPPPRSSFTRCTPMVHLVEGGSGRVLLKDGGSG